METVKYVSEITGISIRTLRYYDEIGLLKPTEFTKAGYRLYDDKALEQLQQILFLRELEIPLLDIKEMLNSPNYDKEQMLLFQKSLLEKKRDRLNGIIELISDVVKGANTMSFEAFSDKEIEDMVNYTLENMTEEGLAALLEVHGSMEGLRAYIAENSKSEQGKKNFAQVIKYHGGKEKAMSFMNEPPKDISQYQKECTEIMEKLSQLKDANDAEKERQLISQYAENYKQILNLDNARAILIDTAKEYLENQQLKEATDKIYGANFAEFFANAIQRYYGV